MVEAARSPDPEERRLAFERVVQAYWKPVYVARAERYASVIGLAADIRAFQAQDPVSAYPEGPLQKAGRVVSRYRVPIALVLTYMLMRLALIFWTR